MMNKFKEIRFNDIIIAEIVSVIFTLISYNFLYKICRYKNLHDFYIGISIFNDHNKYLDICIYFLYLLIFFTVLLITVYIKPVKIKPLNAEKKEPAAKAENSNNFISKIKKYLLKYQYLGLIGFIFLHPLNSGFYPVLGIIIFLLIIISAADIYIRNKNKENLSFSPFVITSVIFILMFSPYCLGTAPVDNHHFGEKYAVFLMHNNFNLDYYKDIMLVHGITDVIPSWLGAFVFNENNIFGYSLGEVLYRNLMFIILYTFVLFIFDKNSLFLAPALFIKVPSPICIFICTYLIMLKKSILNKPYLCIILFTLLSFLFISIWTTAGSFWTVSCIPFFLFALYKIYKSSDEKKYIKLFFAILPVLIITCFFHTAVIEYLKVSMDYINGSLYSFGNNFDERILNIFTIFEYIYKMFVLLFLPILIIELIKQFHKKRMSNILGHINQNILFLLFAIIFPLSAISYMLGRIDGMLLLRAEYFSVPYLFIVFPYFIYKFSYSKKSNFLLKILLIFIIIIQLADFSQKINLSITQVNVPHNTYLYNTGNINIENEKQITNIKNVVYKENENKSFLDLTNNGMLYLYLNKKIPIKYVSFYNSISTKQSNNSAEKLNVDLPDIILIKTEPADYRNTRRIIANIDGIFPSLRVNSLYRTILLSGKYKIYEHENNIFLIKTEEKTSYTNNELKQLDEILSSSNLEFLPEVWANSIKTLPLHKISAKFCSYVFDNKIVIKFNTPKNIKDLNLMYITINNPAIFTISINNSESIIKCKSRTGKILVPLDNFPSWLLNSNLNEIIIEVKGSNTGSYKVDFFNRN